MKKKMIIMAVLCVLGSCFGVLMQSGVAEAKVTCTAAGAGAIKAKKCAQKIVDDDESVKTTCSDAKKDTECKKKIKNYLTCGSGATGKKECKNAKESYAKDVKAEMDNVTATKKDSTDSTDSSTDSKDSTDGNEDTSQLDDVVLDKDDPEGTASCTSLLPPEWCDKSSSQGITNVAGLIVSILTGMVLTAGTIGIIICGYIWLTAQDNAAKVEMAKRRMLDIVIGLVAWVLLAALANLIIPQTEEQINSNYSGNSSSSSSSGTDTGTEE